jgi:hypothetical protein
MVEIPNCPTQTPDNGRRFYLAIPVSDSWTAAPSQSLRDGFPAHRVGAMSKQIIREFDQLCLTPVRS